MVHSMQCHKFIAWNCVQIHIFWVINSLQLFDQFPPTVLKYVERACILSVIDQKRYVKNQNVQNQKESAFLLLVKFKVN